MARKTKIQTMVFKARFTGGHHNGTDYQGTEWGWFNRRADEDIYGEGTWTGETRPSFLLIAEADLAS